MNLEEDRAVSGILNHNDKKDRRETEDRKCRKKSAKRRHSVCTNHLKQDSIELKEMHESKRKRTLSDPSENCTSPKLKKKSHSSEKTCENPDKHDLAVAVDVSAITKIPKKKKHFHDNIEMIQELTSRNINGEQQVKTKASSNILREPFYSESNGNETFPFYKNKKKSHSSENLNQTDKYNSKKSKKKRKRIYYGEEESVLSSDYSTLDQSFNASDTDEKCKRKEKSHPFLSGVDVACSSPKMHKSHRSQEESTPRKSKMKEEIMSPISQQDQIGRQPMLALTSNEKLGNAEDSHSKKKTAEENTSNNQSSHYENNLFLHKKKKRNPLNMNEDQVKTKTSNNIDTEPSSLNAIAENNGKKRKHIYFSEESVLSSDYSITDQSFNVSDVGEKHIKEKSSTKRKSDKSQEVSTPKKSKIKKEIMSPTKASLDINKIPTFGDENSKDSLSKKSKKKIQSDTVSDAEPKLPSKKKKKKKHGDSDQDSVDHSLLQKKEKGKNRQETDNEMKTKRKKRNTNKYKKHLGEDTVVIEIPQTVDTCENEDVSPKKEHKRTSIRLKKVFSDYLQGSEDSMEDLDTEDAPQASPQNENQLKSLYKKLESLQVMIPWPVPTLHLIETRVAGKPSQEQTKEIEALKVDVKKGNFSYAEDHQIKKNWKHFCRLHDLPNDPRPFVQFADANKKVAMPVQARIRFGRFLAHGLENRLISSVYKRFQRLCLSGERKSGRFTPEEDKIILSHLQASSSRTVFADIGKLLGRDPLAIEKRCCKLADKIHGVSNVTWDHDFIKEFMEHLLAVTGVRDIKKLKERSITPQEWRKMSERLKIPVEKLRQGWLSTVYPRVFIEQTINTGLIKERLIQLLIKRGENDWRSVKWDEIAQECDGFTGVRLSKMMKSMVCYYVPSNLRKDLGACLQYLYDEVVKRNSVVGHNIVKLKIVKKAEHSNI